MESNYIKLKLKIYCSSKNMAKFFIKTCILIWSKKFQFLEIQLINITSGTELAISGVVDYKILMILYGMTPTQTFLLTEVKNPHAVFSHGHKELHFNNIEENINRIDILHCLLKISLS